MAIAGQLSRRCTRAAESGTHRPSTARCSHVTKATAAPPKEIVGIPPPLREAGGLDPSAQPQESRAGYESSLRAGFLPVRLDYDGLRILSIDPPVFTIKNFLSPELCDMLSTAAINSNKMQQSKIGGAYGSSDDSIRTSTTLALTSDLLKSNPGLQEPLEHILDRVAQLVQLQDTTSFKRSLFSKPSAPGQIVPEVPQVARYQPGQHFLAHEDAFPPPIALQKGYQRRATVLVYLNDVLEGGQTKFEVLGFGVQPQKGMALLFFPAFSGGMPDARTLHTAVDAVSEKVIFQLWLTSGLPQPRAPAAPVTIPGQPRSTSQAGKTKKKRK